MRDWRGWLRPPPLSSPAAPRQSPSGSMMTGLLLPSSRLTFLRAARSRIPQPTSGEPVNVIIATSRCITSGSPTAAPPPVTTLSHPRGRPHSSINSVARAIADSGVWLAGLSTTGQPPAIAGPTLWLTRLSGKLNGLMAPTTPTGTRSVTPSFPSPGALASTGTTSPASVRASAALNRNVSTARPASRRAVRIGLAASCAMVRAKSSCRSASRTAARSRIAARSWAGSCSARRRRAAATARSTWPASHEGTRPTSDPSYGEATTRASSVVTRSPPIGTGVISVMRFPPDRASRRDSFYPLPTRLRWPVPTRHRLPCPPSMARFPFLDWPGPLAFAHQGAHFDGVAGENTMASFETAVSLGYRYLETDAHATSDGVLVAFHDDHLDRLTDLVRRTGAVDRVCIGAFSDKRLARVRAELGDRVCTSMGPRQVGRLLAASRGLPAGRFTAACVQIPVRSRGVPLVTPRFVGAAHRRELPVHVWTINDATEMHRLFDLGVDGIMTDRPDVLKAVLSERGDWVGAA